PLCSFPTTAQPRRVSRDRHRPGDLQEDRRAPRRPHRVRFRTGEGLYLLVHFSCRRRGTIMKASVEMQSEPATPNLQRKSVQILLIEDDPADVLLVKEGLQEGSVPSELNVVKDGVEALAYLRGEGPYTGALLPDLVLLDLKMPKKGGLEVLAEMKADDVWRRIPVIVLTTSDAPEDILRAYDLQASLYITKPVNVQELDRVMGMLRDFCLTVVKLPPRQ